MWTGTEPLSYSRPTLGKPREHDKHLPRRLHRKGARFYYVTNGDRKWIPLGTSLKHALARWAELEGGFSAENVETLIERFMGLAEGKDSTLRQYRSWADCLIRDLGHHPVASLATHHVALWRDSNAHRKAYINGCLSILRQAYRKAREWGWCEHDPVPAGFDKVKRNRLLTHAEFRSIREKAPAWLQNAMDLSYLTSLRESDVCALRWEHVQDFVSVRQQKTGNPQEYEVNEALAALLDRCKQGRIRGLYVIADAKGRPVKTSRLRDNFARARDAAGVLDAGFHDIRRLSATDAKKAGMKIQALLGHTTEKQSEDYVKDVVPVRATPHKRVI